MPFKTLTKSINNIKITISMAYSDYPRQNGSSELQSSSNLLEISGKMGWNYTRIRKEEFSQWSPLLNISKWTGSAAMFAAENWSSLPFLHLWTLVPVWTFQPLEHVLENGPEKWFFYFFQIICFWKAETKLGMNQLEFLGSEVIWGRERSSKVKLEK